MVVGQPSVGVPDNVTTGLSLRTSLGSTEPSAPDMLSGAVATGDVHAIKLTKACLRLYGECPDPRALHATAHTCQQLG